MGWLNNLLYGGTQGESYEERLARQAAEAPEAPSSHSLKPVPVEDAQQAVSSATPAADDAIAQGANLYTLANGQKIIPRVTIERVESHLSDEMRRVEVWVHVRNHSSFDVELTRVNFWRQHTDPGRFLKPGESYEIRIYAGETRHDDAEHKAEVQYKLVQTGDYFQADHHVEYRYERDERAEFYVPEEMRPIEPIRDV